MTAGSTASSPNTRSAQGPDRRSTISRASARRFQDRPRGRWNDAGTSRMLDHAPQGWRTRHKHMRREKKKERENERMRERERERKRDRVGQKFTSNTSTTGETGTASREGAAEEAETKQCAQAVAPLC
jgi:hypothetical protein